MKKLSVIYCGWGERWPLGTLADDGRSILFEYHPVAIEQKLELSPRHLRLRQDAYGGFPPYLDGLPGLIADSLPDGWGRLLMDKQFKRAGKELASISALDRLAFIGERAIGALVFEPHEDFREDFGNVSLRAIAREVEQFVSGHESESLMRLALIGGSPHGARPKALVNYQPASGLVSTDPAAPGTPWLIKFPAQNEHKEACAIEHLYSSLAKSSGIDVPVSAFFDLDKSLSAFGVERFDRHGGMRVPMHTLAGLLHADFRLPSVDYVTFLRAVRFMTGDAREVEKAYLRCVFNVVMNNRDDHAKNVSFLLDRNRRWKLSPAYDLTFSEGPGGEHQMDICGEGRYPARAHLLDLASKTDVPIRIAEDAIRRVSGAAASFMEEAGQLPIRKATSKEIWMKIRENLSRMS